MKKILLLCLMSLACASGQDLEAMLAAKAAEREAAKTQAAAAAVPLAAPRPAEVVAPPTPPTAIILPPAKERKTIAEKPTANGVFSVKSQLQKHGLRLDKTRSFGPVVGPEGRLSVGDLVVGKFKILGTKRMTFPGVFNFNGKAADEVLVVNYKAIPGGRYFYMFCLPQDEPGIPVGAIITPRSWCPMKVIYCKDQLKPICFIPPAGFLAGPKD